MEGVAWMAVGVSLCGDEERFLFPRFKQKSLTVVGQTFFILSKLGSGAIF